MTDRGTDVRKNNVGKGSDVASLAEFRSVV